MEVIVKEKRNFYFVAALCGLTALSAGCSRSWIAGDAPEVPPGAYVEPVPAPPKAEVPAAPVAPKAEVPAAPVAPKAEKPAAPAIKPDEGIPTTPDIRYTVQKNDTLSEIARVFNVQVKDIADRNGLATTAKLTPGQIIFIPAAKVELKGAKKTDDVKAVPEPPAPVKPAPVKDEKPADDGTVIHVVQKGDMLSKLALKYKVPYVEIAKANGIKVDSVLQIGQKLIIPMDKVKKPGAPAKPAAPKADKPAAPKAEKPAKPAAPKADKPAKPAAPKADKPAADGDSFFDDEKPAAAPAAPAAPEAASYSADDIMTLTVRRDMTLTDFARINGRSEASLLVLNSQFKAGEKLPKGTPVKMFIDPNRQK